MGNDGGSIPTRRELVKNAARLPTVSELKATALEAASHSWRVDPVSGERLETDSIVSDWRGRLYNYETVLQGLTASKDEEPVADVLDQDDPDASTNGRDLRFAETGIRSIRDVVRLQGTPYKASAAAAAEIDSGPRWECPVTLKALGPLGRALYLVPCGHVFSDAATDTILTDKQCPACSAPIEPANVIPILPSDPVDIKRLRLRMEALKADGLSHSLKKGKKKEDKKGKTEKTEKKNKRKADGDGDGLSSRINNSVAASVTAKVLAEQDAAQKRRRLEARASH